MQLRLTAEDHDMIRAVAAHYKISESEAIRASIRAEYESITARKGKK